MSDPAGDGTNPWPFRPGTSGEFNLNAAPDETPIARHATEDDDDFDDDFDNNDFDGDDDGQEIDPEHDAALFSAARRMLPFRPALQQVLGQVSNVDETALIAAKVIEEDYRGKIGNDKVDTLVCSALVFSARNGADILTNNRVGGMIVDLTERFLSIPIDENPNIHDSSAFAALAMDEQRLFCAFLAADLETYAYDLRNGRVMPPERTERAALEDMAEFLSCASRDAAEKPGAGDMRLMKRIMKSYNDISKQIGLSATLFQDTDLGLSVRDMDNPSYKRKPRGPSPF